MHFLLGEFAAMVGARLAAGDPGAAITGIATDSRRVRPGDLFVAIRGERTDGHRFVRAALAGGAAAALVAVAPPDAVPPGAGLLVAADPVPALGRAAAAHLGELGRGLRVVGITGSVGKTTTRALAAAALSVRHRVLAPEGNLNTEIGLPIICLHAGPEHEVAVLELAMRGPGEIAHLARICRPVVGALTRIGPSHLEALGSMEAIVAAKGELVAALPPGGTAVLNADDPLQRGMAARGPAPAIWYGTGGDVRAEGVAVLPGAGTRFDLRLPGGDRAEVRLALPGRHQVGNALAAAGVALALGLPAADIASGLSRARAPHDRLEVRRLADWVLIDDVYNASPASTHAALDVLAQLAQPGRALILFADMLELGTLTEAGHREVGRAIAASPARGLATVGEAASTFLRAEAGLPGPVCATPEEAAAWALAELRPGDCVLVKGSRGMEMERAVAALRAAAESGAGPQPGGGGA